MCDGHSNVPVEIGHKIVDVDGCIAPLIKALNDGGYRTLASCCGHGKQPATVPLIDPDGNERWVILTKDRAEGERLMGWDRPPTGTPAQAPMPVLQPPWSYLAPTGTPDTGDKT